MTAKNHFQINRQLLDHPLWTSEPFTKGQAWVDLIGRANYKDGYFYKKVTRINVKRGQTAESMVSLEKRWGWSRGKVSRFLNLLETEQMIVQQRGNQTTIITICNYDVYQLDQSDDDMANDTANSASNEQATIQQTDIKRTGNDTHPKRTNINQKELKKKEEPAPVNSTPRKTIEYLNQICGKSFSSKSESNLKLIRARQAEGRTLEDFKLVIGYKFKEWNGKIFDNEDGTKTKADTYLRPKTLFGGTNFENYLNESRGSTVGGADKDRLSKDEFRDFMNKAVGHQDEDSMLAFIKESDPIIYKLIRESTPMLYENKSKDFFIIWKRYKNEQ